MLLELVSRYSNVRMVLCNKTILFGFCLKTVKSVHVQLQSCIRVSRGSLWSWGQGKRKGCNPSSQTLQCFAHTDIAVNTINRCLNNQPISQEDTNVKHLHCKQLFLISTVDHNASAEEVSQKNDSVNKPGEMVTPEKLWTASNWKYTNQPLKSILPAQDLVFHIFSKSRTIARRWDMSPMSLKIFIFVV